MNIYHSLPLTIDSIHQCGKVGHIEDIAVASTERGNGLGLVIVKSLAALAQHYGCYKVILDCSEDNVKFYDKCGFTLKGSEMGLYF